MKNKKEIVLLNSEGPVLKARRENDLFLIYDGKDNLLEELSLKEFMDFVYDKRPVMYSDGTPILYQNTPISMRANRGELARFTYGEGVATSFVEFDKLDGQWLSPVPSERDWQIEALKIIFPNYPSTSPRWQYLNSLIWHALEATEEGSEFLKRTKGGDEE